MGLNKRHNTTTDESKLAKINEGLPKDKIKMFTIETGIKNACKTVFLLIASPKGRTVIGNRSYKINKRPANNKTKMNSSIKLEILVLLVKDAEIISEKLNNLNKSCQFSNLDFKKCFTG